MKDRITQLIVRLFLSRSGPVIVNAISGVAAWASLHASKYVPGIEKLLTPEVLAAAVFLIVSEAVSRLPANLIKNYGKQIQEALNESGATLKVDGVVLVRTAEAVKSTLSTKQLGASL